ncbi:hypothetical protein QOZ80_2BG0185580 [Eleusine coracana subsp. coracana]|nr:hypothetical protein QOZ80_2BG0185580 [Eleusine coracana subsp. coracana]
MQTSMMADTFPVKPRQSSRVSAAATSRPRVTWWRRRQRHTMLPCLRAQQHSSAEARYDHLDLSPAGGFHPSIWGDFFLHHSDPAGSHEQQTWMLKRAEILKEEVRSIISRSITLSLHNRLQLINTLERLCLDYLFEEEIETALAEVSTANISGCDLQTVALWFYLLRKHGYRVSPDVFVRFRDEGGRFLAHSPMFLLNLYSAASLRTHGELVLDEATLFTRKKLETILPSVEGSLAREIKLSLEIPLPRRRELEIITRWWKDLNIESTLPFARDRIVECYWWMLGVYFEPCYSRGRVILTRVIAIATIFDDIYDSYGTAQECDLFTKCIESWDLKSANDLPECMNFALRKIFDSYQTIENELAHTETYRMLYLKNFTSDLVRGYNAEVKMREDGYVPKSVEEHLQGLCIILRLLDDLWTYEREKMTSHVASTIDSYMKEHNVSIETAREKIQELKEETWKDFNAEWLNPENSQPKKILDRIFNLTRTMEFFYNKDDNFTNCHNIKDNIHSLFVEPFTIM